MPLFYLLAVLFGFSSYLSVDPLKSVVGLLLSLVFFSIYVSVFIYYWVPFFLILMLLSGVLVVLVTITSLSKFSHYNSAGVSALVLSSSVYPGYMVFPHVSVLSSYYSFEYLWVWVFLFLLVFVVLLFMSLSLYSPGALRNL